MVEPAHEKVKDGAPQRVREGPENISLVVEVLPSEANRALVLSSSNIVLPIPHWTGGLLTTVAPEASPLGHMVAFHPRKR